MTVVCLILCPYVGAMPNWDYWGDIGALLGNHGLHLTLGGVYTPSNENIIAIPQLIFAANTLVTSGDNRVLAGIICLMSLGVGLLLASALRRTLGERQGHHSRWALLAFGIVAGIAAFTPLSATNYFVGMSGIEWVGANLLVVAALYTQYRHPDSYRALAVAIVLCLLSTQFYSTGIPALLLLGIQCVLRRDTRRQGWLVIGAGVAIVIAIYFTVTAPSLHGYQTFALRLLAEFGVVFVGAGLTTHLDLAAAWGVMGLLLFAWLTARSFARGLTLSPSQAFWVTLGGYAVAAGLMAAAGRAAIFGVTAAVADRYAVVPALFWVALAGLLVSTRRQAPDHTDNRYMATLATVACAVAVTVVVGGIPRVQIHLDRLAYKRVGALSVYMGAKDAEVLRHALVMRTNTLTGIGSDLRAAGHVPFNGYFSRCPAIGATIDRATRHIASAPKGFRDSASRLASSGLVKLRGWAANGDDSTYAVVVDKPRCIAIVNAAGVVRGLGVAGLPRADVATALQREDSGYGWIGYVKPTRTTTRLYAYARDRANGRWYRLHHSVTIGTDALTVH